MPLRARDGAIGVLTLERLGEERVFSDDEFELVQLFAAQASIALQNAEVHLAVAQRAQTDVLTGLLNHGTFVQHMDALITAAEPFSLVMLDLDHFKPVNDSMGHQAGDRLLKQVAQAIVAASRDSDRVFRYGGDEFAVLLPRTAGDQVAPIAERVRAAVKGVVGHSPSGEARRARSTRPPGPPPIRSMARSRKRCCSLPTGRCSSPSGPAAVGSPRRRMARRWPASSRSSPRRRSTPSRAARPDRCGDRRAGGPSRVTTGAMIYEPPQRVRPRRPRSTLDSPILAGALVLIVPGRRGVVLVPGVLPSYGGPRSERRRGSAVRDARRADTGRDLRPADAEPAARPSTSTGSSAATP